MREVEKKKSNEQQKKIIANIYAQPLPEFASTIIASREALETLIKALIDAIEKGEGTCTLYTSDMLPYKTLVIANDEPVGNLFWRGLELPYTEYKMPKENLHRFGPTEYFDYGFRSTVDVEREFTVEKVKMSEEELIRITQGCIEQGKKYGFPKAKKSE